MKRRYKFLTIGSLVGLALGFRFGLIDHGATAPTFTAVMDPLGPALDALTEDVTGAQPLFLDLPPALTAELNRQRRSDGRRRWLREVIATIDVKVPGFKRLRKGIGRHLYRL